MNSNGDTKKKNMNYYYINTDTDALTYSPHAKWIKYDRAFTSGDYEEFCVQVLGKLEPGDILFMYANKRGVVAAGRVSESWTGSSYKGANRLVYQYTEYTEYRIPVDWYLLVVHNAMCPEDLREIVGWTPPRALQSITDTNKAERLLKEIRSRA